MAKSKSKRKTRSDKFPLTLHKTGQFCKKIKGKLYYFGSEKKTALERYLEKAAYLHSGNLPFSKWEVIFKDPMTTAAAIDRPVHHSVVLELNVQSYRAEQAGKRRKPDKKYPKIRLPIGRHPRGA